MGYSPLTEAARAATAETIIAKRDAILAERSDLIEKRSEILTRLRRLDRELADCRAAARLFELDISFPLDEREEAERQMLEMQRQQRMLEARNRAMHMVEPARPPALPSQPRELPLPASPQARTPATPAKRLTVREFALGELKSAGMAGMKAAVLRDLYERRFGRVVHEKTVGMTLYRLLNDGLVRRDGHTWFFAQPVAETKNPGGSAPGSDRSTKVEMKGG